MLSLSASKYSVFIVLIISIIIGKELSLCKAEANNKLVGCAFNNNNNGNGSLECQETFPVAQAQSWRERRWRNNDPTDMIIMIVIVVAILVFLVGCILPCTKCCGGNDGTCWKEMDRANDYRTYFPKRIPAAEDTTIKEDGDNNLNTVSDSDSNKETQLQPSISIHENSSSVPILEAHGNAGDSKEIGNKRRSPIDCVIEVCACV